MRAFLLDLRYSVRSLRSSPWLAVTAVLAMALGIGLTTAIYSIIDAAMLRGLPFPAGDRVVTVTRTIPDKGQRMGVLVRDFLVMRERQRALEGIAAFEESPMNLSGDERPERVRGARITAGAFALLRMQPALGRDFASGDDVKGAPLVAVLSDDVWRTRFQADPQVLGRSIRVDGEPATVIGVMPKGFRFPVTSDVWLPMRLDRTAYERDAGQWVEVFGRLRPGATKEAATRELTALQSAIDREHGDAERSARAEVQGYVAAFTGGEDAKLLWVMLAAVMLVLVVACVNVANLLLSRAAHRAREIAVRSALGASRGRVVALFLTESLALAAIGALAGLGIAWVGMRMFSHAIVDTEPPFWIVLRMDPRVLGFVAAATATAALVSGCLPALHASRAGVGEVLKDGARGTSGFRVGRVSRALVVAELALSCGLLVAAGMMVSTVAKLRTRDFGVDTRGTVVANLMLPPRYGHDSTGVARFTDDLLARLRAAGVPNATLANAMPVADGSPVLPTRPEAEPEQEGRPQLALRVVVSPGYFAAVGARPVVGRDFDARDRAGAPDVALVNAEYVRRHFAGKDPIGQRLVVRWSEDHTRTLTIVGIAPDVSPGGTNPRSIQEAFYVPLLQWPDRWIVVGAHGATSLAPRMRAAVAAVDPDVAVSQVETLAGRIARRTWFYRVFGGTFTIFGATALFLAALGLYAVMAASVARRARELGVRMALGASTGGVMRLVLRQGGAQVALGGTLGLALGVALSQLLRGLLFGVKPGDPVVMLGVVAVLGGTGIAACLVPALRASRVDPIGALRAE